MTPTQPASAPPEDGYVIAGHHCPKCGNGFNIQLNLKDNMQLKEGVIAYPVSTDSICCASCGERIALLQLRQKIESEFGSKVVK